MESGLRLERMQMLRLERVVEGCDAEILAVRGRPERRAVKKLGVDVTPSDASGPPGS